jgi:hypothetical protein
MVKCIGQEYDKECSKQFDMKALLFDNSNMGRRM